jgi:hypothetical protein
MPTIESHSLLYCNLVYFFQYSVVSIVVAELHVSNRRIINSVIVLMRYILMYTT